MKCDYSKHTFYFVRNNNLYLNYNFTSCIEIHGYEKIIIYYLSTYWFTENV